MTASRRADRLPAEALDLCAHVFAQGLPASDVVPMPTNVIEVRLDDPVSHLLLGGEGLWMHAGSDSYHYLYHLEDDDWAVVYAHDCAGDADAGARALKRSIDEGP